MKKRVLTFLGTIALLTASCTNSPSTQASPSEANSPDTPAETTPAAEPAETPAVAESTETPTAAPAERSGTFVKAEKPTEGMFSITTENGQTYLVLDDDFKTGEGPDVFVLLHKEAVPESYSESDYVNLGMMETFSGSQQYAIPPGTNLDDFQSVVIWCREFSATFGYASLEAANEN